jgi:hypothetical protein
MCAGSRIPQHWKIRWAYPEDEYPFRSQRDAVEHFVGKGAIRVHTDSTTPFVAVEAHRRPTREQAAALREYLRHFERAIVEITDPENPRAGAFKAFGGGESRYHPDAIVNFLRREGLEGLGGMSTGKSWSAHPVQRSTRKGKKYKVRVCKEVRGKRQCKTIHFGASGHRIKPGTKAGDSYCARSSGIKGADDPLSANYWSRRMWGCVGKKSQKSKAVKVP